MIKQQTAHQIKESNSYMIPVSDSIKKKFFIRQTLFLFTHLLRLALSFTLIFLLIQTDIYPFFETITYQRMQENIVLWQKDYISEIKIVSSYNCPEGYQVYTSVEWPGTNEGCICQVQFETYDYFHTVPSACKSKLIDVGCTGIKAQQSIPFTFWKADKLICIKRIPGISFSSNLTLSNQSKKCAQGTNYEIQGLKAVECPITDIASNQSLENKLTDIGFSYSREDNYPIIDLKVTEYDFCPNYDQPNISPDRFQNYVLQKIEIEHCNGSDPRVIEIDRINEVEIFENNQRVYEIVKSLPGFPEPYQQFIYKLGIVRTPPWSYHCRTGQLALYRAKSNFQLSEDALSAKIVIIVSIIMITLWGILYTMCSCLHNAVDLYYRRKNGVLYLTNEQILKIDPSLLPGILQISLFGQLLITITLLLLSLITTIIIGTQYDKISVLQQWLRDSIGCVDSTQYLMNFISEYTIFFQQMIRTFLKCVLICVVSMSLDILYFVWRYHAGDLAQQKFEYSIQNSVNQKDSDIDEEQILEEKKAEIKIENLTESDDLDEKHQRKYTQESNINLTENSDYMSNNEEVMLVSPFRNKRRRPLRTTDIQFQ